MPYVEQERRPRLDQTVRQMVRMIETPGDLVYVLFRWFISAVKPSFKNFCIYVGAFVLLLFEIYRRVIARYENQKIRENGDVEPLPETPVDFNPSRFG